MTIFVGIDDTDSLDSRGTNKLARALAEQLAPRYECRMIVRHQLLFDERIPFTSHNGSAGLWLEPRAAELTPSDLDSLFDELREAMLGDFIPGSDPGLCLTTDVSDELFAWGRRCQSEIVTQAEAREIAERAGVRLLGLGGTNGGIIGALAAVGLTHSGNDGRLVRWQSWPDDLTGSTPISVLNGRDIEVRSLDGLSPDRMPDDGRSSSRIERSAGEELFEGVVDVGKHCRPNLRDHRAVLFVTRNLNPECLDAEWTALKLK